MLQRGGGGVIYLSVNGTVRRAAANDIDFKEREIRESAWNGLSSRELPNASPLYNSSHDFKAPQKR